MRRDRLVLAPFLAVIFVDTLGYATVIPIVPFVLIKRGVTPAAVGAVFAAFSLCQLVTAPLLGQFSDRVGRRPVLALSQAGSVVGFALLAISSAYPIVLLSRVIDGSSAGNIAVCYAAIIDSDREDDRRRGIPALGAAAGGGILVGLGLSALLAGLGLRAVAVAAMLCSLVSLVLTAVAVPETHHGERASLRVSEALRLPDLRRGGVFVAVCAALQAVFFLTLPAYLKSSLGFSVQGTTALIAALVGVAAAVQLVVLPRLLGRLGSDPTARLLIGVAASAGGLVAVTGGLPLVLLAAATFAAAAAALAPVSALLLADVRPDAPMGLIMGFNASAATAGQIIGPIAGYAAFGLEGARGLGIVCIAFGLCAALGLRGLGHG